MVTAWTLMAWQHVQNVNVLTVIASESYESFARSLQSEIAEAVEDGPRHYKRSVPEPYD